MQRARTVEIPHKFTGIKVGRCDPMRLFTLYEIQKSVPLPSNNIMKETKCRLVSLFYFALPICVHRVASKKKKSHRNASAVIKQMQEEDGHTERPQVRTCYTMCGSTEIKQQDPETTQSG